MPVGESSNVARVEIASAALTCAGDRCWIWGYHLGRAAIDRAASGISTTVLTS